MKKIFAFLMFGFGFFNQTIAQKDSIINPLKITGYIETYYIYDFGNPSDHNRPSFIYSYNRHNEVNLNFGYIQAEYNKDNVRGKLGLMSGTYANANLAAETGVLKNIFEANVGVKISKNKNIWIDAGVFASHIGFESAVGSTCWNLTRSMLADNSPYYESGAKIGYTSKNEKWFLSGLILNGWQRIQKVNGNNTPAFGHQITFKPNQNLTFNSSSFVGSDSPDSVRQWRYFHNFYGQMQLSKKWGLIAGFDIGAQQKEKENNHYNIWYSPVFIARYTPNNKLSFAARAEYYADKSQVIIVTGTPNGFQTLGYSLNMDWQLADKLLWRIEGRTLQSQKDSIFMDSNQKSIRNNYFVGTSLSLSF